MSVELQQFKGWRAAWQKPDRRPIYEWGHDHLIMPPSYAIQGRFDVSVTRPLIAVFDAIQDMMVRKVRFRKPPRFGGSMIADIAIPWVCCNAPGPIGWHWQSDDDAKDHMMQKAWPLWKSCKPLMALMPANRHEKTTTEIYFGNFFFRACGANLNNLQSTGLQWVFNDELWLPVWQDMYAHAVGRTRDFERAGSYKIVDVSQAGNANDVEDRNWREGNQAVWCYKTDKGFVPLLFGGKRDDGSRWGLIWNEDAKRPDGTYNKQRAIDTARYVCRVTGKEWLDTPQTIAEWNRDGAYVSQNDNFSRATVSFGVNALLNRTFASIVEEKINALEQASRGDMGGMRDFVQKAECRPWEEVNLTVTLSLVSSGYDAAEYAKGEAWEGEGRRAMMIDRQQGMAGDVPHRWVEIRAFQPNGDSRQLYFGRLNTKEACRDVQKLFRVPDRSVWQDAGFERHEVFKECVEYGWIATFGSEQGSWTHMVANPSGDPIKASLPYSQIQTQEVGGPSAHAHYLLFSENYFADIAAAFVSGRGLKYHHPNDVSPEYLEQLQGEHKVQVKPGVWKWKKLHSTKPNHSWDLTKAFACYMAVTKLIPLPKAKAIEHVAA